MDVEWDTVAPATPSGNLLPPYLCRGLMECTERCRPTKTPRHHEYPREIVALEADYVRSWIEARSGSIKTTMSYYAEARRLLMWTMAIAGKPLRDLSREDLYSYRDFLLAPDPGWIGPRTLSIYSDGTVNSQWRPFEKALTPAYVLHVHSVLRSLFDHLVERGYRNNNPLHAARGAKAPPAHHRRRIAAATTSTALHIDQWHAVLEAIEALPRDTRDQINYYERSRFLMRLFYHLGARAGELVRRTMSDFRQHDNGSWYWQVTRHGNVEHVDVNDDMLDALKKYRQHLELEPFPAPTDRTPLILSLTGRKGLSQRQMFCNVKEIFSLAAELLSKRDPQRAAHLRCASPRWIRNTTAVHSVQLCEQSAEELVGVQLFLRHSKLENTLGHVHDVEKARQAAAERLSANMKKRAR